MVIYNTRTSTCNFCKLKYSLRDGVLKGRIASLPLSEWGELYSRHSYEHGYIPTAFKTYRFDLLIFPEYLERHPSAQ